MRTKSIALAILAATLFAVAPAYAQPNPTPTSPDLIAANLFQPELVLSKAGAVGLTAEQETAIRVAVLKAQTGFLQNQTQLQQMVQTMSAVVSANHVDETQALSQLDKVLSVERQIKRIQVELMVRIKNVLSPEQQEKLRQLRTEAGAH